jgi:4-hydroxy-tetrahydrodipicolinate reductase
MESGLSTQTVGSAARIIVHGASGRMGARLCVLAQQDAALTLVGAVEEHGSASIGLAASTPTTHAETLRISDSSGFLRGFRADVVIDFSSEPGVRSALAIAQACGAALLVGTTGLGAETLAALRAASSNRAILVAANTSLGVGVLAALVSRAAAALVGYEISIIEAHHSAKKDAPSGTAKRLAEAARTGGATVRDDQLHAVRGGDVVGEHTVRLAGAGEYVELTHRATSRDVFVRGALRAAAWLQGRAPGWYTMEDVLGIAAQTRTIAPQSR